VIAGEGIARDGSTWQAPSCSPRIAPSIRAVACTPKGGLMPLLAPLTESAPSAAAADPFGSRRIDLVPAAIRPFGCGPRARSITAPIRRAWPGVRRRAGSCVEGRSSAITVSAFTAARIEASGIATNGSLRHVAAFGDLLEQLGDRVPEPVSRPSGQILLTTLPRGLPDSLPWPVFEQGKTRP
jgi:hypothetical protein